MPQGFLPIFPPGTTCINDILSFESQDKTITYYNGFMPVFAHQEDDISTFRMILAQFYVNGNASQAELVKATGIPPVTLKRAVKLYRKEGPKGFYAEPKRGGPRVLKPDVVAEAERLLDEGIKEKDVAIKLEIKPDTLKKAIRKGIVKKKSYSK
jgi:transposase-like protein